MNREDVRNGDRVWIVNPGTGRRVGAGTIVGTDNRAQPEPGVIVRADGGDQRTYALLDLQVARPRGASPAR
jgi:hypothetical protein